MSSEEIAATSLFPVNSEVNQNQQFLKRKSDEKALSNLKQEELNESRSSSVCGKMPLDTINQISNNNANESTNTSATSSGTSKLRKLDKSQFGMCKICNDKATGIHYGVSSCEGCKVSMKNNN